MARIPRTKSRPLTIDETKYRWTVKGGRWRYGGSNRTLRLIVQNKAEHPGDILTVYLTSKNWTQGNEEEWDFTHRAALTPGDVTAIVRIALKQGWKPEARTGKPFQLDIPMDLKEYIIARK